MNFNFFYVVEFSDDDFRLKNLLWIDVKSRYDYVNFSDVVFFDIIYIRNKYKMFIFFLIGVN